MTALTGAMHGVTAQDTDSDDDDDNNLPSPFPKPSFFYDDDSAPSPPHDLIPGMSVGCVVVVNATVMCWAC